MKEYHKIQTMFKRDMANQGKIILGEWTLPEFEYLKDNKWVFTEKVDGTNIRVMFDGEKITYGGKTDNAQMPSKLVTCLHELFDDKMELFKTQFLNNEQGKTEVCFYGEGYGAGIQKGGCYKQEQDFVLFDIKIGHWFLKREDVDGIAKLFGIEVVPVVFEGTLNSGITLVQEGFESKWGNFLAEGLVGKPKVELKARNGERIITKIKTRDFKGV